MIYSVYFLFIFLLNFPMSIYSLYPNDTIAKGTELCKPNSSPTIVVKQNNLIDTCLLGQEFEISFKMYFNKFQKFKNILNIVDLKSSRKKKNKLLSVKSHRKKKRLQISSTINNFVGIKAVAKNLGVN